MISEDSQCGIEANGKFIPINSVTAKSMYNLCISHKFSPPTSKKLLSTKFNIEDQKKLVLTSFITRLCNIGHKNQNVPVQDFK